MTIGPIQAIFFGFENTDQFHGEVIEELTRLRGRGLIRLIDLFLAVKDPSGEVKAKELSALTKEESVEFGQVIGKLLGMSDQENKEAAAEVVETTLAAASHALGMDYPGIKKVVEELPPGKATGVMLFEHTWAIPLRDAVRRAGGRHLAQGFLTPELLGIVGEQL